MSAQQDQPVIAFASQDTWKEWLAENHAISSGLWLKIARKDSGIESISYAEALDVALCYGWVDGQKNPFDATSWLQRFSPRTPRSKWSKINRARAEDLIKLGHMEPAGLRAIEQAKANGGWDRAYDGQRSATIPDDLRRELEQNPAAAEFFAQLDSQNRYAILYRIQDAAKPETRARRIEKYIAMLNEQKTIYPPTGGSKAAGASVERANKKSVAPDAPERAE